MIGHLGSLESHPLWRICPPEGAACDAPPIHVCIGSDDPITFSTSLPEEYQLLANALSAASVSGRRIDAWIEGARQCGLTSRFTLERSAADLRTPVHFGPEPACVFRRDVD